MSAKAKNPLKSHFPLYDTKTHRSRCKLPGCVFFSHLFCEVCEVHLCITSKRNCFYDYHHSQSNKNDTNRQNQDKSTKVSSQTIKTTTNANGKRSGRCSSVGVGEMNDSKKKCRRNEQIKGINRGHNTRSGRVSMNAVTNTSAEEKRSCRQSTGGSVTESPKCQQNKQIKRGNHGQKTQPGQSTRSIMCPEELVVAEKSVEKLDFMTIIGLARKKRHEKPGKGQTRKIIVPQRYR